MHWKQAYINDAGSVGTLSYAGRFQMPDILSRNSDLQNGADYWAGHLGSAASPYEGIYGSNSPSQATMGLIKNQYAFFGEIFMKTLEPIFSCLKTSKFMHYVIGGDHG